jgi:hypothetical protein
MYARVTTIQGSPDKVDDAISNINDATIPALRDLDGYKGGQFMVNRETGKLVAVTLWTTSEALEASADAVKSVRSKAAEQAGGQVASVEQFEVVAEA